MSIIDRIRKFIFPGPLSEDTPGEIHPIEQKPFKQYTSVMINTITLSSEMDILFLVDNGRAIDFPLDNKNGVLVGTLRGQITVATAFELPKEPSGNDPEGPKKLVLPIPRFQWTFTYNKPSRSFITVGATDVNFGAVPPNPDNKIGRGEIEVQGHLFDISDKVLHIRRVGEQLEFLLLEDDEHKK